MSKGRFVFVFAWLCVLLLAWPAPPATGCAAGLLEGDPAETAAWQLGPPAPFEYQRHDSAFVPGPAGEPWANKLYFMGGRISAPSELPDIWSFDPVSGVYADTGANMIEDVSNYNSNVVLDDGTGRGPAVYVVGGTNKDGGGTNIGLVQRYYPRHNLIESLPAIDNWPGKVGAVVVGGTGSAVVNDVIYVFGGWQTNMAPYFYGGTWALDPRRPSGSRWTDLGVTLSPPRSYIQSAVQHGKIYAMGGIYDYPGAADLVPTNVVEVLDTANLAAGWVDLAPMPVATAEGRGFGFDVDTVAALSAGYNKLYVAGGGDWPDISREVLEYDVETNTWDQAFPDLLDRRVNVAGSYVPLCTPDPNDGLPGMWVFGGRSENGCDPPYGRTEYYPLPCIATCSVLLVDDDWDFDAQAGPNDGGRPYYTSTLEYIGQPYEVWDTAAMGTPTAAELAPYDVVVWFTGYDWQTPVSPTEEVELAAYLDGGGNLLVSSQEQESAFPGSSIMLDYLGVSSVVEDVELRGTTGGPGDPLFGDLGPYDMARPDGWAAYWPVGADEGPFDDEAHSLLPGHEPLVYASSGGPAATRYISDTFKSLYLGFPFEWLPAVEDRAELMNRALQGWFGCSLPCIALTGAGAGGPVELGLGQTGIYTVTVEPGNATQPVDVTWSNGATGTSAAYSWAVPGWHTIGVTATNCYGGAVATASLDVLVTCDELTGVAISGPGELLAGQSGTYSVTLTPPTATLPIDIEWSNGTSMTSTLYSWSLPGSYTVAVTATNCAGGAVVTDTLAVTIQPVEHQVYLPLVTK